MVLDFKHSQQLPGQIDSADILRISQGVGHSSKMARCQPEWFGETTVDGR
jgi:hypothetical protein